MIVFFLDYSLFYLADADIRAQSLILKQSLSLLACIRVKVHRRFQNYLLMLLNFLGFFDSWSSKFYCGYCGSAHTHLAFLPGPAENGELACGASAWPPQHLVTCRLRWRSGSGRLQHSTAGGCLLSDIGEVIVDLSCIVDQILRCLPSLGLLDRGLQFTASSSSGTFVS